MKKNRMAKRGFTLIEALITILIFSVISLGTAAIFREIYSGANQKRAALSSVDQARIAGAAFDNELRNAALGNDGSYALGEASTSEIIFFTSYGAAAPAVNRIRYFTSGTTLYKGVTIPSGSPLDYNLANEKVTPIQTSLANGSAPLFLYYNGNYAGTTTALAQPVNVNSVSFVQMNLSLFMNDQRRATTTFSLLAGAAMRTLKTNLGN